MMKKEINEFHYGDLVLIKEGFYKEQRAILTYMCPESGHLAGYIENDGTEALHYFYEGQLELIEQGFYLTEPRFCEPEEDEDEDEDEEEEEDEDEDYEFCAKIIEFK